MQNKSGGWHCSCRDFTPSENFKEGVEPHREIAKAYFAAKQRTPYFIVTGEGYGDDSFSLEYDEVSCSCLFSDEELHWMRTQWIDAYNKTADNPISYDDDVTFDELYNLVPGDEIDDEIFNKFTNMLYDKTGYITNIHEVDFTPYYCYKFAISFYNEKARSLRPPIDFVIHLTDEEYIELLAQRLFLPELFNYNHLVLHKPQLAHRLTEVIYYWSLDNTRNPNLPFILHFTEIEEDAKAIEAEMESEKVAVTFTYYGESAFSADGRCTVKMTEDELALFKRLTQEANECGLEVEYYDVLAHCAPNISNSLYCTIYTAIHRDLLRQEARFAFFREQLDCFDVSSKEEFDAMSMEECIERYIDNGKEGLHEFVILRINIIEPETSAEG